MHEVRVFLAASITIHVSSARQITARAQITYRLPSHQFGSSASIAQAGTTSMNSIGGIRNQVMIRLRRR